MAKFKLVMIDVDKDGVFSYTDENNDGAEQVIVSPEDMLSWSVTLKGNTTEFQITFKQLSPFRDTKEIRSRGGVTRPLKVDTKQTGRGMSYTVTLPNGWANDPEALVDAVGEGKGSSLRSHGPILVEPAPNQTIPLPANTTVQAGDFITWKSISSGPFQVDFAGTNSPFGQDPLPSGETVTRQVRADAAPGTYQYTIRMTGQTVGEGHASITVSALEDVEAH